MKKLYLILPLALILCFTVGCQDKGAMAETEQFKAQATVEEENKEIENLIWEKLWNEGNLDIVDQYISPNCILHFGGKSYPQSPKDAKEMVSTWREAFPDIKVKVENIIAEGNKIACRVVFTGTHQGEIFNIPPTGKKISISQTTIIRFENGKMVEAWEDFDALGMYQQLGMELKPKEGEK